MSWTAPRTYVTGELVTGSILNTDHRDNLISILPIATMILRAAPYTTTETAVEARWLQCNGVAVSRTTYAALFNYLNGLSPALPFGAGNGTTTFTLPDTRGRIAIAEGEHADVDSMGDSDGAAIANRSPNHHHLYLPATQIGGYSGSGYGTNPNPASIKTSGNTNLQDTPAYLIAGSHFIKYTL